METINHVQPPRHTSTPRTGHNRASLLHNFIEVSPIVPNNQEDGRRVKSMIPVFKTNQIRSNFIKRCTGPEIKVSTSTNSTGPQPSNENALSKNLKKDLELRVSEKENAVAQNENPEDCILKTSDKSPSGWLIPKEVKNRVSLKKRKPSIPVTITKRSKKTVTNSQQSEESLFESPDLPNLVEVSSLCKKRQTYVLKKKSELSGIQEEHQGSITEGIVPLQLLSQKALSSNDEASISVKSVQENLKKQTENTKTTKNIEVSEQPQAKNKSKAIDEAKENVEQKSFVSSTNKKNNKGTKITKTVNPNEQSELKNRSKEIDENKINIEQGNTVSPCRPNEACQKNKKSTKQLQTLPGKNSNFESANTETDSLVNDIAVDTKITRPKRARKPVINYEESLINNNSSKKISSRNKKSVKSNQELEENANELPVESKLQRKRKLKGNPKESCVKSELKESPRQKNNSEKNLEEVVNVEIKTRKKTKNVKSQNCSENLGEASATTMRAISEKKQTGKRNKKEIDSEKNLEEAVNVEIKTNKKTKNVKSQNSSENLGEKSSVTLQAINKNKRTGKWNEKEINNEKIEKKVQITSEISPEEKEEPTVHINLQEESQENEQCHNIVPQSSTSKTGAVTLKTKRKTQSKTQESSIENEATQAIEANLENQKTLSDKDLLKLGSHTVSCSKPSNNQIVGSPDIKTGRNTICKDVAIIDADDVSHSVKYIHQETGNINQFTSAKVTKEFVGAKEKTTRQTILGRRSSKSQSIAVSKNVEDYEQSGGEGNQVFLGNKLTMLPDTETINCVSSTENKRKREHCSPTQSESRFYFREKKQAPVEFWKNRSICNQILKDENRLAMKRSRNDNLEQVANAGIPYNIRDLIPMAEPDVKEIQPGVRSYIYTHIRDFVKTGEVHIEPGASLSKVRTNTAYRVLEGTARVEISKQTKTLSATGKYSRVVVPKGVSVTITNDEDITLKMEFTKFKD